MTEQVFDPVEAFKQAMEDLVSLVNAFDADDTPVTPIDFLQGITSIGERVRAITLVTLTGALQIGSDKIPDEVQAAFQAKREFDSLMSTPEDERKRLMKAIKSINFGQ